MCLIIHIQKEVKVSKNQMQIYCVKTGQKLT